MNAVGKVINGKFEEFANTRKGGIQDLSELTGRVATAEEDIDALETNVAQIDDVITAQGTAINNLDTRTTQQGESITSAEEILAQHGVTLDDLAEKVADILLHKISADKVLTAESESAYADDTFLMSGKKTASLIAQLNGNLVSGQWTLRNYYFDDRSVESHSAVIKKHWKSMFVNDQWGFRFVTTYYGIARSSWICWAYGDNGDYGWAIYAGYDFNPIYYGIHKGNWSDPIYLAP